MHPFEVPADGGEAILAPAGTWSLDLRRLELHWSAEAAAIHGNPGLRTPGLWRALDSMEPLDRAQLVAAVLTGARRSGVFEADARITTPQGARKLVRIFGHVETDPAGVPLALHGLIEEVGGTPAAQQRELAWSAQAMAHGLQARIAAIRDGTQALERAAGDALAEADLQSQLARVSRAAAQAERVVTALARLGAEAPLRREPVDLSALATALASDLHARDPGRQVEVSVQPGMVVDADRELLRIALEVLLSNAWTFTATRPAAQITVDLVGSGAERVVRIADNGVGFEPSAAGRIFQLFTRLPGAEAGGGGGVGLALVRRIVERHGGLIWAHGEPDMGATFFVRL